MEHTSSHPESPAHNIPLRVYYEDTDAGGVVYYANYLKFAERARTEMLRAAGIEQSSLPCFFVVRHATLDLRQPARLDDLLTVCSHVTEWGKASFTIQQQIMRGETVLAEITVKIACVSPEFRPIKIPDNVRSAMEALCAN